MLHRKMQRNQALQPIFGEQTGALGLNGGKFGAGGKRCA
jgi:hypothetical protein